MKRFLLLSVFVMLAVMLASCSSGNKDALKYHFADKDEATKCYLSNEDYFNGYSDYDIEYRLQGKEGGIEDVKEFGASQMQDFTDEEKEVLEKTFAEMEQDLKDKNLVLPVLDEIVLIKSTQEEECGSGAYTHGTQIYLGQDLIDLIKSEDKDEKIYGKFILWHEIFHCLTRNDSEFRKEMYSIINFTVEDKDYEIPASVMKKYISNPDVEHHNAHAIFKIDGKDVECFVALIATEPFKKEGDTFFGCMTAVMVPTDGSDKYYMPEDVENFWEVFGENTGYIIDPEECMADNFGLALAYGPDGEDYKNPEIIKSILSNLEKK